MPTQKRRMSVTLEDHQAVELDRLAELSNRSVSSIIGELVEVSLPQLRRMSDAMEEFRAADADTQRAMVAALAAAHDELLPEATDLARRAADAWDGVTEK